ncbi:hypothetical protein K7472_13425 [Streptomyces sp. PTM05]|uniref:Uncharacterized protein n=1 Tax=Streptantibioticus parmotrematis TaxID=2873249 RepID=A0ABS7QRN0_9ACTN|nr:hypothetical protein [Streptantibioticus parmotrematis]MBY8885847.1 hypothetical protein [Streptantibioticus parmotrematis]
MRTDLRQESGEEEWRLRGDPGGQRAGARRAWQRARMVGRGRLAWSAVVFTSGA